MFHRHVTNILDTNIWKTIGFTCDKKGQKYYLYP